MSHNDNQSCVRDTRLMAVLYFTSTPICFKFKLTYFFARLHSLSRMMMIMTNEWQCAIPAPGDGSYNGDSPMDLGSGNVDRWKIFVSPENICRRVGARPLHQLPDAEQHAGGGAPRQHREAAPQGPQAPQQRHGQWICIAFYHSFNNWIQMFPFCFCVPKD